MASCNSTLFLVALAAISAFMAAAPSTAIDVPPGPLTNVTDMIVINGFMFCRDNITSSSQDGNIMLGNPPTFSNARALLMCGNTVLAETRTFNSGLFRMTLNPARNDSEALINYLVAPASNCTVAVTMPRASATLRGNRTTTLVSRLLRGVVEDVRRLENSVVVVLI